MIKALLIILLYLSVGFGFDIIFIRLLTKKYKQTHLDKDDISLLWASIFVWPIIIVTLAVDFIRERIEIIFQKIAEEDHK